MNKRTLTPTTESILAYLRAHVSTARYQHTIGTWHTALALAGKYRVPREKATLAALLHDAGKGMSTGDMVRFAEQHRLPVPLKSMVIKFNPSLLHCYISAHIARTVFGVTDRDVLDAITHHTVGHDRMCMLAKILYLADATSPDRRRPNVKALRWMSKRDLDRALVLAIAEKTHYVLEKKKWLHPFAVQAWNYYIEVIRSRDNK